jgi:josephin
MKFHPRVVAFMRDAESKYLPEGMNRIHNKPTKMSSSCLLPASGFHERQKLAMCAVHAINNIVQSSKYSKTDFDSICEQLSPLIWFNPHRSAFSIGNYDVNVVLLVLQAENCSVLWHDRRGLVTTHDLDIHDAILWNVRSETWLGRIAGWRHWIALRVRDGCWTNYDSLFTEPQDIGNSKQCAALLNSEKDGHVLLIHFPCTED